MKESREEHWRDVAEYGEEQSNNHDLKWDVYTRHNGEFINREVLVSVPHTKGGGGGGCLDLCQR